VNVLVSGFVPLKPLLIVVLIDSFALLRLWTLLAGVSLWTD
jgi:hypothetical protein